MTRLDNVTAMLYVAHLAARAYTAADLVIIHNVDGDDNVAHLWLCYSKSQRPSRRAHSKSLSATQRAKPSTPRPNKKMLSRNPKPAITNIIFHPLQMKKGGGEPPPFLFCV